MRCVMEMQRWRKPLFTHVYVFQYSRVLLPSMNVQAALLLNMRSKNRVIFGRLACA